MKVTNILWAMFIFTGIILGLSTFNADISNQYSVNHTETAQLNLTDNINTIYQSSNEEMNSSDGGLGGGLFWSAGLFIFKAPIRIAKLFFGAGTLFTAGITQLSDTLGLGSGNWIITLITASLSAVVIFAIIRLAFNKDY